MALSDLTLLDITPEFSDGSNVVNVNSSIDGIRTGISIRPAPLVASPVGVSLYNSGDPVNYGFADVLIHNSEPDTLLITGRNLGTGTKPTKLHSSLSINTPMLQLGDGLLSWNYDEDCLNIAQKDGSTTQVGLENFIRVHSHQPGTMSNGTLVMFSSVEDNYNPSCAPFIANGDFPSLYMIGVLTNDLPQYGYARATTLGNVRNIDTTGSGVGETWALGDLLWAHATVAGKLTKVRPTAPNIVVSVAVVTKMHATEGEILVRPTFFPRLYYGNFGSTENQTAALISTPYAVTFNTTRIASGFSIHPTITSRVIAANAGLYSFNFSAQIKSDVNNSVNAWIWARVNGFDIENSAKKLTISDKTIDLVTAWEFIASLQINDYFELMWAVDNTTIYLAAPGATTFCPATPSVCLVVSQVNM